MSEADGAAGDIEPRAPRGTVVLYGHAEAESTLLEAYRSGRFPHAWLITGPAGIGKATLAYRLARFILAHPDPRATAVAVATSLAVDADHPVARRMAVQAQGDLLVLERTINEKTGKLYQTSASTTCAARSRSSARRPGKADGASPLSIRSTSSTRRGRTRCSRCWRSRRGAACCW